METDLNQLLKNLNKAKNVTTVTKNVSTTSTANDKTVENTQISNENIVSDASDNVNKRTVSSQTQKSTGKYSNVLSDFITKVSTAIKNIWNGLVEINISYPDRSDNSNGSA